MAELAYVHVPGRCVMVLIALNCLLKLHNRSYEVGGMVELVPFEANGG